MSIDQWIIALAGPIGACMIGEKSPWNKIGAMINLGSQPFWLYAAYTAQQWGIFAVSIFWTVAWAVVATKEWRK